MEALTSHISTPEAIESVIEVAYTQIDRILSEAPVKCPNNSKYDSSASAEEYIPCSDPKRSADLVGFLLIIAAVCLLLIYIIILSIIAVRRIRQEDAFEMDTNIIYRINGNCLCDSETFCLNKIASNYTEDGPN